jgi:amino acid transporter/nucleotide-binding universal stress UspA family protein
MARRNSAYMIRVETAEKLRIKSMAQPTSEVGPVQLARNLSLFDITMVGVGAMIGAGIFVLTGIAAGPAGPALILAFALNGIVTFLTAMVYAELGSAIPEAGGGYLWIKQGLPAWNGFLAGWMSWFAHAVAGSLYALGFGAYSASVLQGFGLVPAVIPEAHLAKGLAVIVALVFIGINFKGVSETGKVGNVITLAKILILAIFVVSGIAAIMRHPSYMAKFTPFATGGITGVLTAMGLTFIAFEGYEIIVQAGEEVKNPKRNIPRAIFLSLAIVVPIYMLVAFAAIGAVELGTDQPTWQWLAEHAELGLAEAARQFMPFGATLLLVGGLFSTMSALNATTFSSTRVSFAMGRDRNLPAMFARIHERTQTPYLALVASGALIIFMAVAIPIADVAAAADVMFLLLFLQVNIAIIVIRKRYSDKLDYGFLMPFHPVLPAVNIGLIAFLALFMFHFSAIAWFFVIGWIVAGLLLHRFYAAPREREEDLTPILLEQRAIAPTERFRVLVPVANPKSAQLMLNLAARIARPLNGELVILHVAKVPPQTPLTGGRRALERLRPAVDRAAEMAHKLEADVHSIVRVAHEPWRAIVDTVEDHHINFVVMGWRGQSRHPETKVGRNIDRVLKYANCDLLVVEQEAPIPARRILIPVAEPADARLLVSVGRLLLDESDPESRITVLHVVSPDSSEARGDARLEAIKKEALSQSGVAEAADTRTASDNDRIEFKLSRAKDTVRAIVSRTKDADLLVVGSSRAGWLKRTIVGQKPYRIARRSACPMVMVSPRAHGVQFSTQSFFHFFREEPEI